MYIVSDGLVAAALLQSQSALRDIATSVRQRRHRRRILIEKRIAAEDLIAIGEAMIEPHIELILIRSLVADAAEIVRRPGRSGERIAIKQFSGHSIEVGERDDVASIGA